MIKHNLLKYSRSYPPDDPGHVACKPTSVDAIWQHFSFPELYLSLQRNAAGEVHTAILKILWTKSIILEDLDLLSFRARSSSFSNLTQTQATGHGPNMTSSLRIVYRDSVVGFRYTGSFPNALAGHSMRQQYRRFQISFADPSVAAQFVNMVAPICPCKLSSQPNPPTFMPRMPLPFQTIPSSQGPQSEAINVHDPGIQRIPYVLDVSNIRNTSDHISQSGTGQHTDRPNNPIVTEPSLFPSEYLPIPPSSSAQTVLESSGILDRWLCRFSSHTGPKVTDRTNHLATVDLESLKNTDPDQLEKTVAGLLRDRDFLTLLEKIDSLWKLKGLADGGPGSG